MAVDQKIVGLEDQQSESHDHSSSSSCDHDKSSPCSAGKGDCSEMAKKRMMRRRRRTLLSGATGRAAARSLGAAFSPCGKSSARARRSRMKGLFANANAEVTTDLIRMMKRLHLNLASLKSLLPPSARSSQSGSVIADALRYKRTLEKEIQFLLTELPYYQQVNVRSVESGGLQIQVSCKKTSGLMVALMEAMESFGLHFVNVSVLCQDGNITIDARSSQACSRDKADALKGMLVATISRFSRRP